MRQTFAECLLKEAKKNKDIYLLTADLGWGMWNQFRDELPNQFFNIGASEQAGIGIAVGLALKGKIPFVYSITPFLLWRPAETIRLYLNHEKIPVNLCGSGRDKDYKDDGISHDSTDIRELLRTWPNIHQHWPEDKDTIAGLVEGMIECKSADFISLKRG